jgi:hypothetical protein
VNLKSLSVAACAVPKKLSSVAERLELVIGSSSVALAKAVPEFMCANVSKSTTKPETLKMQVITTTSEPGALDHDLLNLQKIRICD